MRLKTQTKWPETKIVTPQGEKTAIEPRVISASRATDLPAFFSEWFMNRLKQGYSLWRNPFNAKQEQWISFKKCRVFVFWSKNPEPLMPRLPEIRERGYEFYFQYKINGYEKGLEPCVPPLERRVDQFRRLSDEFGKERVIWRFDPIVLGGSLAIENTLERLRSLAEQLAPYTEKLVFSFVDWYRKTERELKKVDPGFRPPNNKEMERLAQGIVEINNELKNPLKLATCAETLDLCSLGIEHNRCVDPELLHRLCPDCAEFKNWFKKNGRGNMLRGSLLNPSSSAPQTKKDSGQRPGCNCAPSKDIDGYNTCRHRCIYCYACEGQNKKSYTLKTGST